jgi:SAM-dependent methyltransferase
MLQAALKDIGAFLDRCHATIYSEAETDHHTILTQRMIPWAIEQYGALPEHARVLDVGAGAGVASKLLQDMGYDVLAVNYHDTDVRACRDKGIHCLQCSMYELTSYLAAGYMGLIVMRHIAEHAAIPLYLLDEAHRLLRDGGCLYVEVPAPDTICSHQNNADHRSVFGQSAWASLIERSGFRLLGNVSFTFPITEQYQDTYYAYCGRKGT